jgi:oligopeptidase A
LVAADVYSAFDEVKQNDDEIRKVGKRFRETFLSLGGSVHPSEVFRRFRGRDPCNKALVSNLGLNKFVNNTLAQDENIKK